MSIPVRNIYYLLCYAWDALEQRDAVDVGQLESHGVADLLARVLAQGVSDLLRRGLDRDYVEVSSDVAGVRGRIDFPATTSRMLLPHARTHCRHDELVHDVVQNRILRASVRQLALVRSIGEAHRGALLDLWARMADVTPIRLDGGMFARVRVHRNNAVYGFLLHVCRLAYESMLVEEGGRSARFIDFTREGGMARLFEAFVRNFYRRELSDCRVGREVIEWDARPLDARSAEVLPRMEADTVLDAGTKRVVVETKYYAAPMQHRFGKAAIRSAHLYQLFSYLKNLEVLGGSNTGASGVLLYAGTGTPMDFWFDVCGHRVWVTSIDLDRPWQSIHEDLLRIAAVSLDAANTRS